MDQYIAGSVDSERFRSWVLGVFALAALLLAALGIYSVISFSVSQRIREIGIRMALGAQRVSVLKLVAGRVLVLTGIGTAIGLTASLALAPTLSSLLFGVGPRDPWTLTAALIVLGTTGILAGAIPAWRATRVEPSLALRYE